MSIKIITDSSSDLPKDLKEKYDIEVVPLNIQFGDEHFKAGVTIDNETFYRKMKESKELPKSACPAPYDFLETFKETDDDLIVLTISKGLSGTYDSAVLAKNMLLEEQPNRKIEVLDASTGSPGMVVLLVQAAREIENGKSFEKIVTLLNEAIPKVNTFILLETLENVIKGGRLDRFKGTIANALNIKISLRVDVDGKIEVFEKVRGDKKALRRFIDAIGEYTKEFEDQTVCLSHSNCEEKGKAVLSEIMERYPFKEGILTEMGPLIGTYAGEGGLVFSFQGPARNQKI
ncbi:DegV family protein [Bacillus pinisoli]|uniref:DegV family protein n=1 Tax=Bacillus pinisoli TaxID=2901866 RepID=UPI001FF5FBAE|nr:DegV family protein [Bacillus pinisoli]